RRSGCARRGQVVRARPGQRRAPLGGIGDVGGRALPDATVVAAIVHRLAPPPVCSGARRSGWKVAGVTYGASGAADRRRGAPVHRRFVPNINCMPSKNEIWSAKVSHLVRHAVQFGTSITGSATVVAGRGGVIRSSSCDRDPDHLPQTESHSGSREPEKELPSARPPDWAPGEQRDRRADPEERK